MNLSRPYKPDPAIAVVFGRPPSTELSGILGDEDARFLPNPPDPSEGMTLRKRVRGKWYWRRLRDSDEVSQAEAAAFLRVSRMQVNRWVRAPKLRDTKVLGTSRILVRELLRFAKAEGIALRPKGTWLVG
jgi:hypothetical protein